jgi:hypothetical protein
VIPIPLSIFNLLEPYDLLCKVDINGCNYFIRKLRYAELQNCIVNDLDPFMVIKYGLNIEKFDFYNKDEISNIFNLNEINQLTTEILKHSLGTDSIENLSKFVNNKDNDDQILNIFSLQENYFSLSNSFYDITTGQYLFLVRGTELLNSKLESEQKSSKANDLIKSGGVVANKGNL